MLSVTNKNAKPYRDRWNGEEFVFEPGKPLVVNEHVAAHIFGYGLDEKEKIQKMTRAGWLKLVDEDNLKQAFGILYNFVFKEVAADWREVAAIDSAADGKKAA